jgi:uncharacterized protein YpbB
MIAEQVREADATFRAKSAQAENAIAKYTDEQLGALHDKFLLERGGSLVELDEVEAEEVAVKVPSHEKTKEMLQAGMSIIEIAEARSFSVDTIIGHIEKLLDLKEEVELKHTLPPKKIIDVIKKTFKELKTTKLTPVYEHLKGKYSYQDIRIVRASLR